LCQTVLVVASEADEAAAAAIGRITDALRAGGYDLLRATTAREGAAQIPRRPSTFPVFSHDIHGVRRGLGGPYEVMCVTQHTAGERGGRAHA
jgi:hypothetical protein